MKSAIFAEIHRKPNQTMVASKGSDSENLVDLIGFDTFEYKMHSLSFLVQFYKNQSFLLKSAIIQPILVSAYS